MAQGFIAPESDRIAAPSQSGPRVTQVIPPAPNAGKTSYRQLTPEEIKERNLNPGRAYQIGSDGKVDDLGEVGGAATGDTPDRPQQIQTILDNITRAREIARKPFAVGNLAGNTYFQGIPVLGQNAADLAGALEMAQGDLIQQARKELLEGGINIGVRGADTEKEAARIAASKANLSQSQSYDEFLLGLDRAEQYYRRALERMSGGDPAAPQAAAPVQGEDESVDRSAPPPIVGMGLQSTVSTESKTVIDPFLEKHGTELAQMLAADPREISNAMILGWIKKNGGNPATLGNLNVNLKFRTSPDRARVRWNPSVDPRVNVPLDDSETSFLGTEKQQAERSASPVGAAVAGTVDTGTLGGAPDVLSLVTGTPRDELVQRQQSIAAENPEAYLAGNFLGGLSTAPFLRAPATLPGLVKEGGALSAIYGAASSEDPSISGRFENALGTGLTGAIAPMFINPALSGLSRGVRGVNRVGRRAFGADPENLANERALDELAPRLPNQDTAAMRTRLARQEELGADPSGLTVMDREGQDFLGRMAVSSPGARQAAEDAVTAAETRLPVQIEQDFAKAIDDAAGGNENIAAFLKRPAREITSDIQEMAGREYEAGIAPIQNERLQVTDELAEVLTHERATGAIRDALSNHQLSDETRQLLRALPRELQGLTSVAPPANLGSGAAEQVAAMQAKIREQALGNIPLTVDAARNLATALDRTASRLADGSEGVVELRRLSRSIREAIGQQYPEFDPVNARYASRLRAIGALDDVRGSFLGDATGKKTDELARATGRMSDEPGEPEFPGGEVPMPSERQMALAGAKEATTAAAKSQKASGVTVADELSGPGQKERNRMVLPDEAASNLEARTLAQAENVETMRTLRSGGKGDAFEQRTNKLVQAIADFGRGWPLAGIAAAYSGFRGVDPNEVARIIKQFSAQGKADQLIGELEKRYGRRAARFIIARGASLATSATLRRPEPRE